MTKKKQVVDDLTGNVSRDSQGLRDALFDEIDMLRAGKSSPQRANAIAKVAVQIIQSVAMEVAYHRHVQMLSDGQGAAVEGPKMNLQLGA